MTPRVRALVVMGWVLGAVAVIATKALPPAGTRQQGEAQAFPALAPGEGISASFETDDTLPSALSGVRIEPVQGRTGPGGDIFYVALRSRNGTDHLTRQIGRRVFELGLRTSARDLSQYPCTSCHEGRRIVDGAIERDPQGVHQNIRPLHPDETGAQCSICHSTQDPGMLRLQNGGAASLDHAYRLCAQCHFLQVEWWAKGSHGKRLVGWRGRRVVTGCADCHDPHRPATVPRIPMGGVELPGELRGESHD